MRVPSTPARFASVCSLSVPCGAAASVRKSLHPYNEPAAITVNAVPRSRGCFNRFFITPIPWLALLERSDDADAEHPARRVDAPVDAACLIPVVAGGDKGAQCRQRRIVLRIFRDREEVTLTD